MPTCNKCGAPISFLRTPKGRLMPVNRRGAWAVDAERGGRYVLDAEGIEHRAAPAQPEDPGAFIAYFPHWGFCPGAEEVKRERKAQRPEPERRREPKKQPEQISFLEDTHGSKRENRGYWRL